MGRPVADRACPNVQWAVWGEVGKGNSALHGFLRLKRGRRPTFRDVFTAVAGFVSFVVALIEVRWRRQGLISHFAAAQQQLLMEVRAIWQGIVHLWR